MSDFGISEALRWDADFRATFTSTTAASVTDDLPDWRTPAGTLASFRYEGILPDGRAQYRIRPDSVPGQSQWWHERGHDLWRRITDRTGPASGPKLIAATFALRGAIPDSNWGIATEQWASLLPECFLGVWGGFAHPIWGTDYTITTNNVRSYFATATAATMRGFFLTYATWTPEETVDDLHVKIAAFWQKVNALPAGAAITKELFLEWAANLQGELDAVYVKK